jgi:hypothetical protein
MADKLEEGHHAKRSAAAKDAFKLESPAQPSGSCPGLIDTPGHLEGDADLRHVSEHLRRGLRRNEAIGKYGGEEFLILLPQCLLSVATKRAEELRAAIQADPIAINAEEIVVTCSFGLTEYTPGCSVEELVCKADACLYVAKSRGRNCVWPGHNSQPLLQQLSDASSTDVR